MVELGTEAHIGNQIIEGRIHDTLYNYRDNHALLPQEIIDEMRRYVNRYPSLREMILNNLCASNWTVAELDELLR